MKQFILTHKLLCIILACVVVVGAACAVVLPIALKHEHTFATEWTSDKTNHWHKATCDHSDEKSGLAAHDFNDGEITTPATEEAVGVKTFTCNTCGFKKTEEVKKLEHTHKFATEWTSDETNHWHAATCEHTDSKKDEEAHDFDEGVVSGSEKVYTCKVCDYEKKAKADTPTEARDNDITVGAINFTYNGKAQPIDSLITAGNMEGMIVKYVGVDGTTYAESVTAPINAGTYQYTITIPATEEWKEAEKSGKFTIAQYELKELYEIKTAEYNGTDRIWVKFKNLAENKDVNIAIIMESANAGAKVSYVHLPGLIDDNYTYNQEKVTATIIPKKLSGLEIHIKESDIDDEQKEQPEIYRFSTTIDGVKINGENEKVNVTLEFFWKDLDDNDDLQLTPDHPGTAGTEKCKIIINNANYELDDSNIGRLFLDRETAES